MPFRPDPDTIAGSEWVGPLQVLARPLPVPSMRTAYPPDPIHAPSPVRRGSGLAGMSLGGLIAQMVALDHPGRVSVLALIASEPLGWDGDPLPHVAPPILAHFGRLEAKDWADGDAVTHFLVEFDRLCATGDPDFDPRPRARRSPASSPGPTARPARSTTPLSRSAATGQAASARSPRPRSSSTGSATPSCRRPTAARSRRGCRTRRFSCLRERAT